MGADARLREVARPDRSVLAHVRRMAVTPVSEAPGERIRSENASAETR